MHLSLFPVEKKPIRHVEMRNQKQVFTKYFMMALGGIIFLGSQGKSQSLAELSYKLWNEECPKSDSKNKNSNVIQEKSLCENFNSDSKRISYLKKDLGEISENAFLSSLAKEKSLALECSIRQLDYLKQHPEEMKKFIEDYQSKLVLLGHEKKVINELRDKRNKTSRDLADYDQARRRAEAILESIPFQQLQPFQKIISYTVQQYDQYTPDRLEIWLPQQLNRLINDALNQSKTLVESNKSLLDKGVTSLGATLEDAERESLAQDTDLIEMFRQSHVDESKDLTTVACRVDAKYGKGAKYRDQIFFAMSLLSIPAAGLLRAGASAVTSSITAAVVLGKVSIRSAGVLRALAAGGLSAVSLSQINKACFANYTEVTGERNSKSNAFRCEGNILKSQEHQNCVLVAGLNALGIHSTYKGVTESLEKLKSISNIKKTSIATESLVRKQPDINAQSEAAIQAAHKVGRGELGTDGTAAKVGNYTYRQKLEKARILKKAGISKADRKKLFEDGVVGDSDYMDDLIQLEDEIKAFESQLWRQANTRKNLDSELRQLRTEFDHALDASTQDLPDRISKLRKNLENLNKTKVETAKITRIEDLIENPAGVRNQIIPIGSKENTSHKLKFEDKALDDFSKAEKNIQQKFISSIKSGASEEQLDADKIRFLNGLDSGKLGKAFEIRIINRGHQRLLGCYQNGILTVMKYDSHAPETHTSFTQKYKRLCH